MSRKGIPNKATQELAERLRDLPGFIDPLDGLCAIAADPTTSTKLRIMAFGEVAGYLYPKRKAVEVTGSVQATLPPLWVPGVAPVDAPAPTPAEGGA